MTTSDPYVDRVPIVCGLIAAVSGYFVGIIAFHALMLRKVSPSLNAAVSVDDYLYLRLAKALAIAEQARSLLWLSGVVTLGAVVILVYRLIVEEMGRRPDEQLHNAALVVGAAAGAVFALTLIFTWAMQRFDELHEVTNASLYESWKMAFVCALVPVIFAGLTVAPDAGMVAPMAGLWMFIGFGGYWYWSAQMAGLI